MQPVNRATLCTDDHGAAVVSFVACHATTDADIEVAVAGRTIGHVLHLNLARNHSEGAEKAVRGVALPMFQDAAALALDAADDVVVIITSRGCGGVQTMRHTLRVRDGGVKCV